MAIRRRSAFVGQLVKGTPATAKRLQQGSDHRPPPNDKGGSLPHGPLVRERGLMRKPGLMLVKCWLEAEVHANGVQHGTGHCPAAGDSQRSGSIV